MVAIYKTKSKNSTTRVGRPCPELFFLPQISCGRDDVHYMYIVLGARGLSWKTCPIKFPRYFYTENFTLEIHVLRLTCLLTGDFFCSGEKVYLIIFHN